MILGDTGFETDSIEIGLCFDCWKLRCPLPWRASMLLRSVSIPVRLKIAYVLESWRDLPLRVALGAWLLNLACPVWKPCSVSIWFFQFHFESSQESCLDSWLQVPFRIGIGSSSFSSPSFEILLLTCAFCDVYVVGSNIGCTKSCVHTTKIWYRIWLFIEIHQSCYPSETVFHLELMTPICLSCFFRIGLLLWIIVLPVWNPKVQSYIPWP